MTEIKTDYTGREILAEWRCPRCLGGTDFIQALFCDHCDGSGVMKKYGKIIIK